MPASVPYAGQVSLPIDQRFGARPHVLLYGAVPDAKRVTDAAMSSGSATLTSATGKFKDAHVGQTIVVPGAGSGGALLVTTIAGFTNATTITLTASASAPVSGARVVWGTDNADAFDAAFASLAAGGNALYLDGGGYLTTRTHTIEDTNLKIYGACHRLDIPHTRLENGAYTCIFTTANPGFYVSPYPGVEFRDIIFEGLGTTDSIEIYEQTGYTGQIGIWAGYAGAPLTLPTDDYGAGPGSGGLTMKGCTFSNFSGWGVIGYKLYGKSVFDRCRFYQCGVLVSSATENERDRHGALHLNSESVDIDVTNCHFLGPFTGTDRGGTAIKLGGKSTDATAMSRFYLGCSHVTVTNCLVEGNWFSGTSEYMAIASAFSNMVYGNVQYIRIGENPFVSALNCTGWWRNIDLSGTGIVVYVYTERITLDGFFSETSGAKEIRYYYPGAIIKNCKNINVVPSGDKSAITRNSELWDNRPLAFTDQPNDGVNLLPDYESTGGWTVTASPTGTIQDRWKLKLYNSATAEAEVSGLTPGAVYTFGFRCYVTASFAEMVTYRLEDGSGAEVLENQIGETAVDILNTEFFIMVNVVAPADGTLAVSFANASPNQVEFCAPWLVKGFASQMRHGGYEFLGNPQTGLVTGRALDAAGEWEHFDTVMSRKFGGFGANLTARRQTQVGLGANIHYDGSEWVTGHDVTDNAAAAILSRMADGALGMYVVPSTATGAPQKLNDTQLAATLRVLLENNDRLNHLGTAGTETNLVQRKRDSAASPSNIEYRLSHRGNNEDWMLIGTDGSTSLIAVEVDWSTQKVLINGVDVTAILPGGGTVGNFLQKTGSSTTGWAQVDMGVSTNVKTTGATLSRFAFLRADGTLEGKEVNLTDATHVELPITSGWFLISDGGVVNAYSPEGAASAILGATGVIGIISGLAGFDLTTLNTVFTSISAALDALNDRCDDLQTQVDGKAAIGHGHSGTTASGGSPAHTHGWST